MNRRKNFISGRKNAAGFLPALLLLAASASAQTINLPTVELLGGQYYYYEIKKGDSPYGIAKRYGWDYNTLVKLNPEASSEMKKGSRLYYPTPKTQISDADAAVFASSEKIPQPISHVVRKGETVYSIARMYGISTDDIYRAHPSARQGIKAGETITISKRPDGSGTQFYTIKSGDTLYAVARANNTTVEDILKLNPGVSEHNFRAGATIILRPDSADANKRLLTVTETQLESFDTYKVQKGDTWSSVARKTGVDADSLRKANDGVSTLKKNEIIAVPQIAEVEVEAEVPFTDPREDSSQGRQEIYDSINNITASHDVTASIAIVTDKPAQSRNVEFLRGFLLNLDRIKNSGKRVKLAVIDATLPQDSVTGMLEEAAPMAIVSTFDKDAPDFVAEYAKDKCAELINVFDVRSEKYTENPSVIQILPPSSYFNDAVAHYVVSRFDGYLPLSVGSEETDDEIARRLWQEWPAHATVTIEELETYPLIDEQKYIIYVNSTKKEEVGRVLDAVEKIKEQAPFAEVAVLGRPAWVTLTQTLKDKFDMQDVYVPSRFYFDAESTEGKRFVADYTAQYGHGPLRSFPVYSVSGYDIASWLIPTLIENGGDFNVATPRKSLLQNDIDIKRVSNWGGFLNENVYMIRFNPYGLVEKIVID